MASDLTRKALLGFSWVFSASGGQALVVLLAFMLIARVVTPADFGIAAAGMIVVELGVVLAQFGVKFALIQKMELTADDRATGLALTVAFSVMTAGGIWLLRAPLEGLFAIEGLAPVLGALTIVVLVSGAAGSFEAMLYRDLQFQKVSLIDFAGTFFGFGVVATLMALAGAGVWSIVAGHIVTWTLRSACYVLLAPRPPMGRFTSRSARALLYFGAGFSMGRLANYVANNADRAIVGRVLGAEALGFYERALQLMLAPVTLIGKVGDRVLFPTMSRAADETIRVRRAFLTAHSILLAVTTPISVGFCLVGPELMALLFGDQWEVSGRLLQVLGVYLTFRVTYKVSDACIRALGAVYERAAAQAVFAALIVVGAYTGATRGLESVAWLVGGCYLANFSIMYWLCSRRLEAGVRMVVAMLIRHGLIALSPAIAVTLTVAFMRQASLADHVLVGAACLLLGSYYLAVAVFRPSWFGEEVAVILGRITSALKQ